VDIVTDIFRDHCLGHRLDIYHLDIFLFQVEAFLDICLYHLETLMDIFQDICLYHYHQLDIYRQDTDFQIQEMNIDIGLRTVFKLKTHYQFGVDEINNFRYS